MFPHPTWKGSNGELSFNVPVELQGLREGEKLLLQQISPYVPLQHLQKGAYGCRGHVCSFPQDISSVCLELPRLPSDITVVTVVKDFRDKDNENHEHSFRIRRNKVMNALHWLKAYNPVYHDITIAEENLEWMNAEEQLLPDIDTTSVSNDSSIDNDTTEAYRNIHDNPHGSGDHSTVYGYLCSPKHQHSPKEKDRAITKTLKDAHLSHSTNTSIDFPYVDTVPVNEYDTTTKLFCKAFPWLFPGGIGDINDYSEVKETVDAWMKRLLYFQDCRFMIDKMWVFFVLNYAVRKKNSDSGAYFVDGFFENGPKNLPQLQEHIQKGD